MARAPLSLILHGL